MGLKSTKILGISITTSSKKEILEEVEKCLEHSSKKPQKPLIVVTPNPEQIVAAQRDTHFAGILNQADVAIPDGIGLAWAVGCKRIPGVEFMEDLAAMAAERGYTIGLIGGSGKVAVEALECLQARHPGFVGWAEEPGDYNGYNDYNFYNCYKKIKETNTRLVFVGLGAPKQEEFIERLASRVSRLASPLVFMSVGGSFDIIAGRTPRAPHAMQAMGLEWLWRLVRQPWRWKRQIALVKFLWLLAIKG